MTADYARLQIGSMRVRLDAAMRCASVPRPEWGAMRDEMAGLIALAADLADRCDSTAADADADGRRQGCQRAANVEPAATTDEPARPQLSHHFAAPRRRPVHEKN